jgi:O-glycosyl hydrolase
MRGRILYESSESSTASFSNTRDQEKLIPDVKAAQAENPGLRFWASSWTPPAWMKNGPYTPAICPEAGAS